MIGMRVGSKPVLPTLGFYPKILGFSLGCWDFLGIFILKNRPWDFSWDFSEFQENIKKLFVFLICLIYYTVNHVIFTRASIIKLIDNLRI
jgi:hypothetical protein